jgi:RNA polymerase sigma-70 factor (ECF subfamily)
MTVSLAPHTDTKEASHSWTCDTVRSVPETTYGARQERFEDLARPLVEPLRRYLARRTDAATADDVLAETLLVCWRRLDDVPSEALPWAYGVARNCLANAARGARRQVRLAARIAIVDPPAASSPGPGEGGDPDLAAALAELRDEDAELLRLWAWEQLTPAEIAAVLSITANAASIRLYRAREKLKEELVRRKTGAGAGHEETTEGRRT